MRLALLTIFRPSWTEALGEVVIPVGTVVLNFAAEYTSGWILPPCSVITYAALLLGLTSGEKGS